MRKTGFFASWSVKAALVAGLVLFSTLCIYGEGFGGHESISRESINTLSALSDAMVDVVSAVKPSVVNISTSKAIATSNGGRFLEDPFFRKFFGDELLRRFEDQRREQPQQSNSLGSGVIVDQKGYILTNNHVIDGSDKITVTLFDKREFEGKLIGVDPKTDVAVIKIEADGLVPIKMGDSDALRVGELVIAVGSPYGLMQSVTSGIVSAKGRANVRIADYEDFIQTDAAINPGNSGGPLINLRGELVGINTAIFSTSGGYQGIGFSIPSNMVQTIMESLIRQGKVVRGWLGVTIQNVSEELARQFDLKGTDGVLVADVAEDSPAEKGGLKRGDIIVSFEGHKIADSTDLRNRVASTAPGTKAAVRVMREGREQPLAITIGELPSEVAATRGELNNVLRSVQAQELTDDIRQQLGISPRIKGVVVADADYNETGLQRGDVIMEINRVPVEDMKDYGKAASAVQPGQNALLLLYREGGVFYMNIRAE